MNKYAEILLILLFLFSCKGKENQIDYYSQKEDSLYIQIFDTLIMPDSSYRKYMLIPPIWFPNDSFGITQDMAEKGKHHRDSLIHVMNTARLYIAIDDTLFSKFFELRIKGDTLSYFKHNLDNLDTTFYKLFKKCISDTLLKKRKINTELFTTKYNYQIVKDDFIVKMTYRGSRVVELNHFSRVIFNDENNQACFCQASVCGSLCGGGYIIFCEKKNGKWKIASRILLFVS
jgi:hypothetical protein